MDGTFQSHDNKKKYFMFYAVQCFNNLFFNYFAL